MKLSGFLTLAALLAVSLLAASAGAQITNPLSAFPVDTDAHYGAPSEWSDITPAWFHSDGVTGATPVAQGDPSANSLLFAALAKDTPTSDPELYLMYDYLPRTTAPTVPGEFLGSVSFPLNVHGVPKNITVTFSANSTLTGGDITVDLHDGSGLHGPAEFGMEGAIGPGFTPVNALWGITAASAFHTTFHELIELGIPLNIKAGFGSPGGPFPSGGLGGDSGYSPDPAFWTSDINKSTGADPPASGGLFTIQPDGSTFIVPTAVPTPEPSTFVLGGLGALGLWVIARKRRAKA